MRLPFSADVCVSCGLVAACSSRSVVWCSWLCVFPAALCPGGWNVGISFVLLCFVVVARVLIRHVVVCTPVVWCALVCLVVDVCRIGALVYVS